jgi:hypothetical protein
VRVFAILSLFCLLTAAAHAQLPSGNVFVGYSFARADVALPDTVSMPGWEVSLEGKLFPMIGMVADASSHGATTSVPFCTVPGVCPDIDVKSTLRVFTAGPQFSLSFGRFSPFVHGMVGGAHIKEGENGYAAADTSFAVVLGGGLDYRLFHLVKWRIQADEVQTRFFNGTQNNLRVATGVVVHF